MLGTHFEHTHTRARYIYHTTTLCDYCSKCEIKRSKMLEDCLQEQRHSTPRTIERIEILAHLVCGVTCFGCGMHIVDPKLDSKGKPTVQLEDGQMYMLKRGEDGPKTVSAAIRKKHPTGSWLQIHKGVVPGAGVAFRIKVSDCKTDILHMANCIMNALMYLCFWKNLEKYIQDKESQLIKDKDDSRTMSKKVFDAMKIFGFSINKLSVPEKSEVCGEYMYSLFKCSYAGGDVNINLVEVGQGDERRPVWQVLLDMIFPASGRPMQANGKPDTAHEDFDINNYEEYCWAKELWTLWAWIWKVVNISVLPKNWMDQMKEAQKYAKFHGNQEFEEYKPEEVALRFWKGDMIDVLSLEFVRLWGSRKITSHNYPHLLCGHLGQEIRDLLVDIKNAQAHVFENSHQKLKKAPDGRGAHDHARFGATATQSTIGKGGKCFESGSVGG